MPHVYHVTGFSNSFSGASGSQMAYELLLKRAGQLFERNELNIYVPAIWLILKYQLVLKPEFGFRWNGLKIR